MENREFALEALKRLAPDTRRCGEAFADEDSFGDVDILEEIAYYICLSKEDRVKAWALTKEELGWSSC